MPSIISPASCLAFLNELARPSPNTDIRPMTRVSVAARPAIVIALKPVNTAIVPVMIALSVTHAAVNTDIVIMSVFKTIENPLIANAATLRAAPSPSMLATIPASDTNNAPLALIHGRIDSITTPIACAAFDTIGPMASPMVVKTETTDCLSLFQANAVVLDILSNASSAAPVRFIIKPRSSSKPSVLAVRVKAAAAARTLGNSLACVSVSSFEMRFIKPRTPPHV